MSRIFLGGRLVKSQKINSYNLKLKYCLSYYLTYKLCHFVSIYFVAVPHLEGCVAVIHSVFDKQILEHTDGHLPYLGPLLQGPGHLPQEQAHQKVIPATFLREAELQTLLCCRATQGCVSVTTLS